jgi:arylsulfatase
MALRIDGAEVDATSVDGILPLALQHGGAGLRLGWDSGFPVSARYSPPAPFNGTVHRLNIETPGGPRPEPADEVRAALHAD